MYKRKIESNNEISLQFSQKAMSLMRKFFSPQSSKDVVEMLSEHFHITQDQANEIIERLLKSGMLLEGNFKLRDQAAFYSDLYSNPDDQKIMLLDWYRTDAYRRAIQEVVSDRTCVVDVGAGSGILSLFSASAGAKKVYAVEVTEIINLAKKLATINNLSNKIEFLNMTAQNVVLDQKVDVIISEWMGMFAMDEYMFDAVQIIRDRFLAEGGKMIPNSVDLYIAPIENRHLYYKNGPGFWKSTFFNYDFNVDIDQESTTDRSKVCIVTPESLIASPHLLLHFDCNHDNTSAFHFSKSMEWTIERDAFLHGFCGYFDTILTDKITLYTSPMVSPTHWQQVYFPIEEISVQKSDVLCLTVTTTPAGICPTVCLNGNIVRNGKVIHTFKSKPFVDGPLVLCDL
jgi:2-polyprenyl-3-methyl-5-hydroxy-6-metoxy-1,4-benzoquinol methylase